MDPDANLKEQRELAAQWLEWTRLDNAIDRLRAAERLAELVQALDEWLSKGGYLPAAWQRKRVLHGYTASGEQVTVSE